MRGSGYNSRSIIFRPTPLAGAFVIEPELLIDERGFFARTFCQSEFLERGLVADLAQCSISFNKQKGTLRGMHYQGEPHPEAKLVRCTKGAIWDVIVDLRLDSQTFAGWHGVELSAQNHLMQFVPQGFAHGFQTLEDDCEIFYQISEPHYPELGRGVRHDDPRVAIAWPLLARNLSERDRSFPLLPPR